jgi:hypothetical protein
LLLGADLFDWQNYPNAAWGINSIGVISEGDWDFSFGKI